MTNVSYTIYEQFETYAVDAEGNIGRPAIGMVASGDWKVLGLEGYNNFGTLNDFIPFREWPDRLPTVWTYKNGKPIYHVRDLDHGVVRSWGRPIFKIEVQ